MSARRPPFRALARIVMLVLLAFAAAAAPALSFAAETHEAIGHPGEHEHEHAVHGHAGDADTDDGGKMLHLVTQLGICCGHACALLPDAWRPSAHAAPAQPDARPDPFAPGRVADNPLRPPIAA